MNYDEWHPWFAWRPVPLFQEGRWTWLRHLERRAIINPFWHLGPDLFSPPYWFEYRLPEGR